MVVLVDAKAVRDGQRVLPGKNSGAGVALFFRIGPELLIAGGFQLQLSGLELGLLQAEEVGVRLLKKIQKALAQAGAQAVDIPGNQLHLIPP